MERISGWETEQFIEANEKISASQAKNLILLLNRRNHNPRHWRKRRKNLYPYHRMKTKHLVETNDSSEESFETTSFPSEPEESEDSDETVEEQRYN